MIHQLTASIAPVAGRPSTTATTRNSPGTLAGWGTLYDTPTGPRGPGGAYRLRLSQGLFTDSIKSNAGDIRMLAHHDSNCILGRLSSGTLRLADGPTGLLVSVDLPATELGWEMWELSNRGDIDQMSVSFSDYSDDGARWLVEKMDGEKTSILQIDKALLSEISLVAWPAIKGATFWPQAKAPGLSAATRKPSLATPAASNDLARLRSTIAEIDKRNSAGRITRVEAAEIVRRAEAGLSSRN